MRSRVYAIIRKADPLGTLRIESRVQMAMLPYLKPRPTFPCVGAPAQPPLVGFVVLVFRARSGLDAQITTGFAAI